MELGIPGLEGAEEIGRGGFAVVYRAYEPSAQRFVAVKVLRIGVSDKDRQRFEREAGALGKLSEHPNVVTLYRTGVTTAGEPYLVMPFLASGSLKQRLDGTGIRSAELLDIARALANGLSAAHSLGVLHCDLKPDNVLRSDFGVPQIADFGIAQLVDSTSGTSQFAVTPAFSAPEVIDGHRPTAASDVYGLGATLHALATGRAPFTLGDNDSLAAVFNRVLHEPPADLRQHGAPGWFADLVARTMAKDPAQRPHLDEVLAILADPHGRAGATGPTPASLPASTPVAPAPAPAAAAAPITLAGPPPPPAAPGPLPVPPARSRRAPLVAVLVVLALVAVGVVVATRDGDDDTAEGSTSTDEPTTDEPGSDEPVTDEPVTDESGSDEPVTDEPATDGGADGTGASSGLTVAAIYDVGGLGDQGFNDLTSAGVAAAATEFGTEVTELTTDGTDRSFLLDHVAESADIVVAVGFLFEADAVNAAAANPDTTYVVVDATATDFSQDPPMPMAPNLAGIVFDDEQAAFLVGAAAALTTTTQRVGFIGGVAGAGGLIEKYEAGFRAGVAAIDPAIAVDVRYLTTAPDFDGFDQPDEARTMAIDMYSQGADVIYHAAAASGRGMFEAARDHTEATGARVWGIGVDVDEYTVVEPELQPYVLTSSLKLIDVAVSQTIGSVLDGTFQPGARYFGVADGALGYAVSGGNLSAEVVLSLQELRDQIADGTIEVPTDPTALTTG